MDQTHVPQPPKLPTPHWFARNLKWLIPTAVVGVSVIGVAIMGAFLMLVFGMMKSSGAYTQAYERAVTSPSVQELLGQPIEAGFFVTGNVNVSGSGGSANLSIPLTGPKGKATLFVIAEKTAGKWQFRTLTVQPKENNERIDLLIY